LGLFFFRFVSLSLFVDFLMVSLGVGFFVFFLFFFFFQIEPFFFFRFLWFELSWRSSTSLVVA